MPCTKSWKWLLRYIVCSSVCYILMSCFCCVVFLIYLTFSLAFVYDPSFFFGGGGGWRMKFFQITNLSFFFFLFKQHQRKRRKSTVIVLETNYHQNSVFRKIYSWIINNLNWWPLFLLPWHSTILSQCIFNHLCKSEVFFLKIKKAYRLILRHNLWNFATTWKW